MNRYIIPGVIVGSMVTSIFVIQIFKSNISPTEISANQWFRGASMSAPTAA